jgi:urease accessory protein
MKRLIPLPLFALTVVSASAHPLQYHVQTAASASSAGFLHPFTGLDHLMVMVAVGLWAVRIGGRALWLLPCSFVASMILGASLGTLGTGFPAVEHGIVASLLMLGVALGLAWRPPVAVASAAVALAGLFHGFAHGSEMPSGMTPSLFLCGMVAATALLHASGIVIGKSLDSNRGGRLVRGVGVALVLATLVGAFGSL